MREKFIIGIQYYSTYKNLGRIELIYKHRSLLYSADYYIFIKL